MALFKSSEERRIERDIKIKQGIRQIERAIREQAQFQDEFVRNAQRAQQIGDTAQYQFIRNSLKKTAAIKKMLERQLLAVKNALLIKKQAEASADFANAMGLMASEIGKLFGQMDLAKTQTEWEKAMIRSQNMEARMNIFLDTIQDLTAHDMESASPEAINDEEIDKLIAAEAEASQARDVQKLLSLRMELDSLKGRGGEKQK